MVLILRACLFVAGFFLCVHGRGLRRAKRGWLSNAGMPTDDVTCAFNPCNVPNFCGEGRTCKIDNKCMSSCECNTGSKHERCVNISSKTTTPPTIKCTFNPCSSPAFACSGGRQCELNDFCMPECVCKDHSDHPTCMKDKKHLGEYFPSIFTKTPKSQCDTCVHGTCRVEALSGKSTCDCHEGWEGSGCDDVICTKLCQEGHDCHILPTGVQICIYNHTKHATSTPTTTANQELSDDACHPNYIIRPLETRTCSPETTCIYGTCTVIDDEAICQCDHGAVGDMCEFTCCLECDVNRTCTRDAEDQEERCSCDFNHGDDGCDEPIADFIKDPPALVRASWYWWVVGTCIFVLVLLLVLLVVVPYVMWKHRVILIMKVVHYFQGYEDDDEREWDAFISYKGNTPDEDFVVRTLFPKLAREMGFNINVHFKDFVPGEAISDSIINAVERSRRTIMVVSPHYLTSSWTKFEWQMAQQKMLERKHRIIPILLDDVSHHKTAMDRNLKIILDSVTYIEWPRSGTPKQIEKFWKRIELSMPKIKNRQPFSCHVNGRACLNVNTSISTISNRTHGQSLGGECDAKSGETRTKAMSDQARSDHVEYNMIDEQEMLENKELYDTLNEADIGSSGICKRDQTVDNTYEYTDVDCKLDKTEHSLGSMSELAPGKLLQNLNSGDSKAKENEYVNCFKIDL